MTHANDRHIEIENVLIAAGLVAAIVVMGLLIRSISLPSLPLNETYFLSTAVLHFAELLSAVIRDWFWYYVIVGLLGAWTASDARDRGCSQGEQIGIFAGVLLLSIIALIAWFLFRPEKRNKPATIHESDPMQILKARYARGEITNKEFEDLKRNLK